MLQAAVRLLELNARTQTRRNKGGPPSLADTINVETLPEDLRDEVRALLDVREAAIYGHLGSDALTEGERLNIKTTLNRWKATA